MYIKKFDNGNFNIRLEKDYDKSYMGQPLHNNCTMSDLSYLLCDSAELDFQLQDEPTGDMWLLYNANTQQFYWLSQHQAKTFSQGKSIKLTSFNADEEYLKEHFSYFRD